MKHALVIHPILSFYAGGEYLCLNVCEALLEMGYRVTLACDVFSPLDIEKMYGLGKVMENCEHIRVPEFRPRVPRFTAFQRLLYRRRVWPMFKSIDADVVFSTQSSPFILPKRVFHFVYSGGDVFGYPPAAAPLNPPMGMRNPRRLYFRALEWYQRFPRKKDSDSKDWFFAVGSRVLLDIKRRGFQNSSFVLPPCRVSFRPRLPKRKQVVQAARLVPEKRLDLYFEIASKLPDYKFYLIGRDSPELKELYPGYSGRVLSKLPENVTYVNGFVRQRPELFEESKVYLYTGVEPGIGLALVEAIAAGCIPFSPPNVGATDVMEVSGVGLTFNNAEDAAVKIRRVLEQEYSDEAVLRISEASKRLSPEVFKRWIRSVIEPE